MAEPRRKKSKKDNKSTGRPKPLSGIASIDRRYKNGGKLSKKCK